MTNAPVTPAPAPAPSTHTTWLQNAGAVLGKDLKSIGHALVVAAPYVAGGLQLAGMIDPALAPILLPLSQAIISAEAVKAAVGAQTGTGADKAQMVLAQMEPIIVQTLQKEGLPSDAAAVQQVVDKVVAFWNQDPEWFAQLGSLFTSLGKLGASGASA